MSFYPERKRNMFESSGNGYASGSMRTDIRRKDDMYYLDIEVPGYAKEDIRIALYNGTLTVTASHSTAADNGTEKGRLLRRERFLGNLERSFRVSTALRDTDIRASLNNGILTIALPSEEKKEREEKKYIEVL